jgi:sugar phosphate isomerase/epimerase
MIEKEIRMALQLGVIMSLREQPEEEIAKVAELGLPTCQLACWEPELFTDAVARRLVAAQSKYSVEVSSLWAGYPGPAEWNFTRGPATIGLVPPEYRETRVEALIAASDFAVKIGTGSITTHAGFIPENPADPLYDGTVAALAQVARACKDRGLWFCLETGQETPITLRRAMVDVGTDNLAVNLDPANLILYGKANPVDALDVLGPFIRGVHAKDGLYPTDPRELGRETPLGEGKVNFPVLIPKLKSFGFSGPLTIEREIAGPQQIADIKRAIEVLKPLC